MRAIQGSVRNYAGFRGRAARSEFWWTLATILAVGAALAALGVAMGGPAPARAVVLIWGALTLLPVLAVAARRFHDYDLNARWLLLAIVPVAGLLFVLWVALLKGTEGGNRFGPDPLEKRPA